MIELKLDSTYVGEQFSLLRQLTSSFVLKLPNVKHKSRYTFCVCECGKIIRVEMRSLLSGNTRSCGSCLHITHGKTLTPEYVAWHNMKRRCDDLDNHDYGGRGIDVCMRWRLSFEAFLEDVGPKPSPSHELDRYPNNDGDYEPGNVRWATRLENARNKRRNN